MDPVYLTEEMIQQFGLLDAVAGDLASMQDLEIMGLISKTDDTTGLPILPPKINEELEVLNTNAVIDPEVNAITNDALNAVNNTNIDPNIKPPIDQNVVQQNK